jgi:hypothetical protein
LVKEYAQKKLCDSQNFEKGYGHESNAARAVTMSQNAMSCFIEMSNLFGVLLSLSILYLSKGYFTHKQLKIHLLTKNIPKILPPIDWQ